MKTIILIMLGLSLLQADYIRDDTKDIVLDTSTNLMWQDDNDAKTLQKNWEDAITYCEAKTLGGYSDWRLPNINELSLLADRSLSSSPVLSSSFDNVIDDFYWSSTTYVSVPTQAWNVLFSVGYTYRTDKTTANRFVRCVR